ncbi:hypothetical protein [Paraburkholderia sp. BCC1876]|uniref:hypothetical protein n=1 Tax=Paraburkholderia sp. BCC1876 TaxID=2676303 RepID=UPI0015909D1D|nr:hypothetical protein [Paraburkholderia sp. BCC1876]
MKRDLSSSPALKTEDNWSHCLPGFRLTHTLHLVSDVNLDVVAQAAAHLKSKHAPVNHWAVVKRGKILEQKITLDDISEQQARVLREHLLTLQDVLRVRLEHRFVRCDADTEPAFVTS